MTRLRGRDVVRLEGDVAAQVYRRPRDEELPEGKHLIAVDPGTVTVGMIYDGMRFTRPAVKSSPVVVVKETIAQSAIAPFSIPPPLPKQHPAQQLESPQSNSIVVNVHKDGEVTEGQLARQPHGQPGHNGALSGKSVSTHPQGGEPAASAAPHPSSPNVAATSSSSEFSANSPPNDANSHAGSPLNGELQQPVISINTSIDEVKRKAAEYIEKQARGVLDVIPPNREVTRQAIAETVTQAEATLVKCVNKDQVRIVVEAFARSVKEYVEGSGTGGY